MTLSEALTDTSRIQKIISVKCVIVMRNSAKGGDKLSPPFQFQLQAARKTRIAPILKAFSASFNPSPSPKAEPFKRWLAKVGYERIQEIEDPELAIKRTRATYRIKGYSDEWIEKRMRGIDVTKKLDG